MTSGHDHHHEHHEHHEHEHHEHGHGNAHDRGWRGSLRYARLLAKMWRSPVSDAVVALVAARPGERLVDIGAGMGPATVAAAKTGATVIAVEPTPFMRRILRTRRLWQRARSRITVIDGAAEAMAIDDASVDALWAVNVMHHWTNLDAAVHEIHRVVRCGARVYLVDEDFDDPGHPLFEEMRARRAQHHHAFDDIDPHDVAARLQSLGFTSSTGSFEHIAGRPAKVVRGIS